MLLSWTTLRTILLALAVPGLARAADPVGKPQAVPPVQELKPVTATLLNDTSKEDAARALADAARLRESLAKWEQVKRECGGDYFYTVRFTSAFGFGSITTVTVKGSKVVERRFETFDPRAPAKPGEPPGTPQVKWIETEKVLGSHKNEGVAPRTVDALYAEAQQLVGAKLPPRHQRSLGFTPQGLLSYCYTRAPTSPTTPPNTASPPSSCSLRRRCNWTSIVESMD